MWPSGTRSGGAREPDPLSSSLDKALFYEMHAVCTIWLLAYHTVLLGTSAVCYESIVISVPFSS